MPVKWTPETDQIVRNSVSSLLLLLGAISLSFPKSQLNLLMLPSCFWKFLKRHMWARMRRPSLQLGVSSFIFYNFASLADLICIYIFWTAETHETPTPRAISERIFKIKTMAKSSSAPSSPQKKSDPDPSPRPIKSDKDAAKAAGSPRSKRKRAGAKAEPK